MTATDLPFRITFPDPEDLTDWDYEAVGDEGTDDPESDGWVVRPMGGTQFMVISPDCEAEPVFVDGEIE